MLAAIIIDRSFASLEELCEVLRDHYWRRSPVVFRHHGLGDVLGGARDIVSGLRALRPSRVYVDGVPVAPTEAHRATDADASLEAYFARLATEHASESVALVGDDFERSHPAIWFRCTRLLGALYRAVGFPAGDAAATLFAGSYPRTPFGFHKDDADVITHVIAGRKRYLIWDYRVVAEHFQLPEGARYENLRYEGFAYAALAPSATILDTEPGDLVYWPWDCFHVAEPEAGLSVSVGLGVSPFATPFAEVERIAKRGAYATRSESFAPGPQTDLVEGTVAAVRHALDDVEVLESLRETLLYRRTRFGFRRPLPEAHATSLTDDQRVCAPTPDVIAWWCHDGRLWVSANGHGFRTDDDPKLVELLTEINRGRPLRVADLRARFCANGAHDDEELDAVLGCLWRFRALEPAPAPSPPPLRNLFRRSGWFPLHLTDDGASVLLAPIADHEHRLTDGFERDAYRVPLRRLFDLYASDPPAPCRRRYIFTAGYSGSTLLCRAVEAMPKCFAVHEPPVLADWSRSYGALAHEDDRRAWLRVLDLLLDLLFRSSDGETKVVVKVGECVQEIMAEILDRGSRPTAVHLYTPLTTFLAETLKSPVRRKDLATAARAPQRAKMLRRIGAPRLDASGLSDARAIAHVWLSEAALYRALRRSPDAAPALRALDFDRFLDDPARGLRAFGDHLDLDLPAGFEETLAHGDVFKTHSKPGRPATFDRSSRTATLAAHLRAYEEEISDALDWARRSWGSELPARLGDELLDA